MHATHLCFIPRSRVFGRLLRILLLLAMAVAMCSPPTVYAAATHTVTSSADAGPGTLREALSLAGTGDTIVFSDTLLDQTITLTSTLVVDKDLTIDGSALASPVTLSGGGVVRILEVVPDVTVSLEGLVLVDGQVGETDEDPENEGGAIKNYGTLTLTGCVLVDNRGYRGGAILNGSGGDLTVTDCWFSGNYAASGGGGIYNAQSLALHRSVLGMNQAVAGGGAILNTGEMTVTASTLGVNMADMGGAIGNGGVLTVSDSTLAGNTADMGGAIFNVNTLALANSTLSANVASGGTEAPGLGGGALLNMYEATIRHTTFAGNSAPEGLGGGIANTHSLDYANTIVAGSTGGDCVQVSVSDPGYPPSYEIVLNVHNLVEDGSCAAAFSGDPLLGPLADNGGPTQTMALLAGSPAIGAADYDHSLSFDQRGVERPDGKAPDIGAYELRPPLAATTGAASDVSTMGASLHATVTAGDRAAVTFEVGTTEAYGTTVAATPGVVTGTAESPLSVTLDGLDVNTTYHYRVVAANDVGVVHGEDRTFTTDIVAPEAVTEEATGVTATAATLHATVNAVGAETYVSFEYGPTTSYGSTVAAVPSPVTGRADTAVSAVLSGLEANQMYHFRVVAVSAGGETHGEGRTFTPGQNAPLAVTGTATAVGETGAVLRGTVNSLGYDSTVAFSYGLTTAYGTTVAAEPEVVSGTTDLAVMSILSGLRPNTTYHYRVEAESAAGRTEGSDATFSIGDVRFAVVVPLVQR